MSIIQPRYSFTYVAMVLTQLILQKYELAMRFIIQLKIEQEDETG